MRRVLFVAYHFPPLGGAGVQRSTKFVRYLRDFGYEPVVVTGGGRPGRWSPADAALAGDLPPGLEVRRAGEDALLPSGRWRARGERWLGLEPPFAAWWRAAAVDAGRGAREVDLVFATMSPWESGEAAAALAQELRVPLVLDLRDPWALDEMTVYPTLLHRRRELARMQRLLRRADAVVMNTHEATLQLRRAAPELDARAVFTIPNGFDAADFAGPAPARSDRAFRIVHAGFLHTDLGRLERRGPLRRVLGGAVADVDIHTRSHVYLLAALHELVGRQPELVDVVELHLAGALSQRDLELARSPLVRTPGYLTHAATVELVRSADLLFLPMQDLASGRRATIVPGKTYEYLASGVPILAAVPPGDARDLVERAGNGVVCGPRDVAAMAAAVEAALARRDRGEPRHAPSPAAVAPYERRSLTERLAEVFDAVLGAHPSARCAA